MITTSTGTTVKVEQTEHGKMIILDSPHAPADMRNHEAGRIIDGGFQPAPFALFALRPEVLRVIAGLVEGESV